jgi:hypothetical protein
LEGVVTELYAALCAPFAEAETFTLAKGGSDLTYITGEAVTTRLNTVLGVDGWTFEIVEQGRDDAHAWVLGRLTAYFPNRSIARDQFGECAVNKGMLVGDARKGAATDALKKCASLVGVGLYLSRKEEQTRKEERPAYLPSTQIQRNLERQWGTVDNIAGGTPITCEVCGEEMRDTIRDNGTVWTATEKADFSRKKFHGRVLCYGCSRNAG